MLVDTLTSKNILMTDIAYLANQPILKPFDITSMAFIESISKKILLEKASRQHPELMAMAHWLRKAHMAELKQEFEQKQQTNLWLARGTVLHFAPANVDTIFMYSWVLSLLVGNNNIIRISSRRSPQVYQLLSIIHSLFQQNEFKCLADKNSLISYQHDDSLTEGLSSHCDVRIIWGGDTSVKHIRKIPLPVHAKEVVFVNKFSMAAFNASIFLETPEDKQKELVRRFYNDAFWFNQLACSSPRLVIWVGKCADIKAAKQQFWQLLDEHCALHETPEPSIQMSRLTQIFELAANDELKKRGTLPIASKYYSRVSINPMSNALREHRGGYLFLEWELEHIQDASSYVIHKDQTLSVYGFDKPTLTAFIESLPQRAIDRIVPVGEALNFQSTWDGYTLFQELTRELTINIQ